jgi:uncharacterized spore protein YtfJ
MSLPEVLKTTLDKIQYIAKTETVFGNPIEAGGVVLIPVSKVSIGFAAGGTGADNKIGAGSGTGGGVQIIPVAFISISGDEVKIHSLDKSDPGLRKIFSMAPEIIKKVSEFLDKKSRKEKKMKKQKPSEDTTSSEQPST